MSHSSAANRAFIGTEYLSQLIELLAQQGINTSQLAQGTGLSGKTLASAQEYISPLQYHKVVENALALSGDPLLGLEHGKRMNISSHGFLGFAIMASDTLGQALSLAIRYARTRTLLADIRFIHDHDSAIIQINRLAAMPSTFSFVVQNIISTLVTISRFLTQNSEELTAVAKFTDAAVRPASCYEGILGIPVMFNQPHNQLCIPAWLLDIPVSTANTTARRMAEAECEKQLAELDRGQDLVTQIRRRLDRMDAFPTLTVMASTLNSSPRTINRQLAQLNTTYQNIIDEARREQALQLLLESNASVEDIAQQLGYNDPSNFGRAFRRWLGESPRAFRKRAREQIRGHATEESMSEDLPS
ncbi:MAG: AraC family transcriptional regulator [Saccharospirillaceae bacterium]|nr:AraC family transcriptional regulator [Saccharospirillaceae bacterium]MCD8532604.1 AraC family transcriptional regulator [Saccharospirillaceae bacterium]